MPAAPKVKGCPTTRPCTVSVAAVYAVMGAVAASAGGSVSEDCKSSGTVVRVNAIALPPKVALNVNVLGVMVPPEEKVTVSGVHAEVEYVKLSPNVSVLAVIEHTK